ncbi:MAG: hypothetical protein FWE88_01480 [Phycisphaerae bacterium]|nr:hypothetical protein [Phycisphaerae bacterium]
MTIHNRTPSRGTSLAPTLAWLGGGIAVGILAGLAFIFFAADHVLPRPRGGDSVAGCSEHLADLANEVWRGYNQGHRADSLDDLRVRGTAMDLFRCPAAGNEHGHASAGGLATDYVYAPGIGEGDAIEPPLLFELPSNHGQTLFHVMPRDLTQPTEVRDSSQIHGHVQHLNDYLTAQRERGLAEKMREGR